MVDVYEAELVATPDDDHATIRVVSGKGFYVRAMARDLALALGAEGHVSQLRRTRVGALSEDNAITLAELEAMADTKEALLEQLKPLETVLDDIPTIDITSPDAAAIKQGRDIVLLPHAVAAWEANTDGDRTTLSLCDGQAVALGEVRAGRFQPKKVFQL